MYFVQETDSNPIKIAQTLMKMYFRHDYESIFKILEIEDVTKYKNETPYKYSKNQGMMFCDNENPPIYIRVYVDKETRYILNTLSTIISNSVSEKFLIDLMIEKWIAQVNLTGRLDDEIVPNIVGKESYIQLEVGKRNWENFLLSCKNKGITSKIGLKMSIFSYLDEICHNVNFLHYEF